MPIPKTEQKLKLTKAEHDKTVWKHLVDDENWFPGIPMCPGVFGPMRISIGDWRWWDRADTEDRNQAVGMSAVRK